MIAGGDARGGGLQALPLPQPAALQQAQAILQLTRAAKELMALTDWMAAPNHDSEPLKSCLPFPGLLGEAELEAVRANA